jgi:hypothetical protein
MKGSERESADIKALFNKLLRAWSDLLDLEGRNTDAHADHKMTVAPNRKPRIP